MPRRPRLAVVKVGEVTIEVYDEKLFWELWGALRGDKGAIRSISAVKHDRMRKSNQPTKAVSEHSDSGSEILDSGSNQTELPAFIQGNPWLDILGKRSKNP